MSQSQCSILLSPGRCPLKLASLASWTGMIDNPKDWGCHTRANKEREQVNEPGRFRERGHDRERERGTTGERERERQRVRDGSKHRWRERETERCHCPSSMTHNRLVSKRKITREEVTHMNQARRLSFSSDGPLSRCPLGAAED